MLVSYIALCNIACIIEWMVPGFPAYIFLYFIHVYLLERWLTLFALRLIHMISDLLFEIGGSLTITLGLDE